MNTEVLTIKEIKQLFVQILINNTSKVTKVSDHSINSGVAFGVSKLCQKCL